MLKKLFILSLFPFFCFSQAPLNDTPCLPNYLGTLPQPIGCPNPSFGDSIIVSGSTVNANPEPATYALNSCFPSGNISNQSPDVWFKFTASAERVSIKVSGSSAPFMSNPGISLFMNNQGMCLNLTPIGCIIGTGGQATTIISGLTPYTEYYIQVRGCANATDIGNFTLTIKNGNDCLACAQNSFVQTNPMAVNGFFPENNIVQFTYTLQGYRAVNGNYLKGVIPTFTSAWDITGISATAIGSIPASGTGNWIWSNTPTPGFFYDQNGNGNITDDMGDPSTLSSTWVFKFTAKTKSCSLTPTIKNLQVDVNTKSDGEFFGTSSACSSDPDLRYKAVLNCCDFANVSFTNTACLGDCNGSINVIGSTAATYPFGSLITDGHANIIDSVVVLSPTATSPQPTGLCEGSYNILSTNQTNTCIELQNVYIDGPISYTLVQNNASCAGSCTNSGMVQGPPTTNYIINWSGPSGTFTGTIAQPICPGWYHVFFVDPLSICPTYADSIEINGLPPDDASVVYSNPFCNITGDTVIPFIVTPGGTFTNVTLIPGFNTANGSFTIPNGMTNGDYYGSYTTPGPCFSTDTFVITLVGAFDASFYYSGPQVFCKETSDTIFNNPALYGVGNYIYNSVPPATGTLALDGNTGDIFVDQSTQGTYVVTHKIILGTSCDTFESDTIKIIDTCLNTSGGTVDVAYNAISPNMDGYNDFWFINGITSEKNMVYVFNRYGAKVFEETDYNNVDKVWAGKNEDGKKLPPATYFYVIHLLDSNKVLKGWIELME
ncbi:MAG: gliding motility-associated C-terminal domain-containing protein [Bacteroidia bacterium]|nr:gliding motility-associated C-terminal domain-containing protein [Bacteroidia bacterium]